MNSSPRCKLLPYLGSKTKLFQGLSYPKFLVKCSDYLSQQKLHNISVRTISSKACLIPSENTTNALQTELDTSRSRSLDRIRPTTNPNLNLLTLPPLETTQTAHSDNETDMNKEENNPIEVIQTEPNAGENPKKRVKIIKIKPAPSLSINSLRTGMFPQAQSINTLQKRKARLKITQKKRIRRLTLSLRDLFFLTRKIGIERVNKAPPKLIKGIKSFKLEPGFMPKMVKAGSVPNAQTRDKFFDFSNITRNVKKEDLTRMFYNTPSQSRAKLPLLIIHFEGIIGSCLIQVKRGSGESSSSSAGFYKDYFVKKDARDELKALAKQFLIAVVMSNSSEKSKKMMKLFINRKYPFDACYYRTKEQDGITANDIAGFILDYDSVVNDFKVHLTKKKVIILSTIDLSPQIIRKDFLAETTQRPLYNKSSLLNFFPKIRNVTSENLKIVCLPNFLLEEKYEDYRKLVKSSFSSVSKLVLQLLRNIEVPPPGLTSQEDGFDLKKETENPEEENQDYIETDSGGTDIESGDKLVLLNFAEFIKELEKTRQFNLHRKQFEKIKEKNNLIKEQAAGVVQDVAPVRQKIINEMLSDLQTRENVTNVNLTKMNISNTVTNLLNNNAFLLRNKFKSHQNTVSEITEYLQVDNNQQDEDPEILAIEHIKQMAAIIKVFLDD